VFAGPPATPVERLRAELTETLEGVVDAAFDPLRGTQERRDQLARLIGAAHAPQVRRSPAACQMFTPTIGHSAI